MDKLKVYELIKSSPAGGRYDPILMMAIVAQESSFDETAVRMENDFRRRYLLHKTTWPTTSSVLLATSFGLMQMLGESLLEVGYFEFFQDWYNTRNVVSPLIQPRSQIGIVKAIDEYMLHPDWHIRFGMTHFEKKMNLAHADQTLALGYWNGDQSGEYAALVMKHYDELKATGLYT